MTDNNYFAAFDDAANSGQQKSQPKVAESTAPASSSGNYFSSFDNAANDSPQKQSAMPSGADEGAFMAGVDKINQMGSDLATNTLLPIMKVLRIGDDSTYSKFTSLNQQANVQANNSANIHPWGSAAGGLLMGGMEGAAAGMGAAALGAGATLAGAASGAVPTFLSSPGSLTDRAVPTAVAGVAGGALGYLGSKLLDGTAQAAKDVQPIVDAKNKVQDLINNAKVPDIDKIQKTFYDTIAPNTHLAPEETQALLQDFFIRIAFIKPLHHTNILIILHIQPLT